MKYFFVLGNNKTLSIAEISAIFGLYNSPVGGKNKFFLLYNIFILETDKEINAKNLIKRIGGIIKIGIINNEINAKNINIIKENIVNSININKISGKFKFGFSYYGKDKFNIKPLAMETKKYLKEKGISCRWVISREQTLSSVVVEQNKLTSNGLEIILIENNNKILVGKTLATQPFKELSFRDYGRPARDDKSGMLPPKIAQIMINLSQAKLDDNILDPFCGSGTILTEALLMNYKNLIGSDSSQKAIDDTKKNINWIIKNYKLRIMNYELINNNSTQISKFIKPNSINAIITEPYLGPQRGKIDIKKTIHELEQLYSKSLEEFKKVLKKDGRVVMIFPVFYKKHFINPNLNGFKILNFIPNQLLNNKNINLTNRNTIIYGREGQKVWREIVVLKKIKIIY
ncbi:MAG: DNA methyltransferase [Candidatus Falkowbacteria bacterium]